MAKPNFFDQGMSIIKQAIAHEKTNEYVSAEKLYGIAIQYFEYALKYEKQPREKQKIESYIEMYEKKRKDAQTLIVEVGPAPIEAKNHAARPQQGARKGKEADKDRGDEQAMPDGEFEKLIMTSSPGITFDSIAGLDDCKRSINEALVLPRQFPQTFEQNGIKPWGGMLLFGPPGTGKTQLARAVATEIGSSFFAVSATTILDKWVGQSEKNVEKLFATAIRNSPSIIFIDEVEALMSERSSRSESSDVNDRVLTQFLQCIDGITSVTGKVFVLAATNFPEKIDSAMLRRFEKRIYVPLPDKHARVHILRLKMRTVNAAMTDEDYDALGDRTAGYSGADITTVVNDAKYAFMRKYQAATHLRQNEANKYVPCNAGDDGARVADFGALNDETIENLPITLADIADSLSRNKPSTTTASNQKYLTFMEKFK